MVRDIFMAIMDKQNQINNMPEANKAAGAFQYGKTSWFNGLKEKISLLTPKKKRILIGLIIAVVVILAGGLYFVLAGTDDPGMRLTYLGRSLANQTFECGKEYKVVVMVDVDPTTHATQEGNPVMSVKSTIKYNPVIFNSVTVESGEGISPFNYATSQVDAMNSLISIDAQHDNSALGVSQDNQILANLILRVADNAPVGETELRFDNQVVGDIQFVAKDVTINDANFNFSTGIGTNGIYPIEIKCTYICAGNTCSESEFCSTSWVSETHKCCLDACLPKESLYLEPAQRDVNTGESLPIKIMLAPDQADIGEINITLDYPTDLLQIDDNDIVFQGVYDIATVVVNNGHIVLMIKDFVSGSQGAIELATLNFTDRAEGTAVVNFNANGNSLMYSYGAQDLLLGTTGGTYNITTPTVRLCSGTEITVTPTYNSATFEWCTEPESGCTMTVMAAGVQVGNYAVQSKNFQYTVNNLAQNAVYDYNLVCIKPSYVSYDPPGVEGTFTTLIENQLKLGEIQASKITAHKATISWLTSGGANGNGLADSEVVYRIRPNGQQTNVFDGNLTTNHGLTIQGLTADKTYDYYVRSKVAGGNICEMGTAGVECAASTWQQFTTIDQSIEPDANIILKVNRDRICDEWLYCNASVQVLNNKKNPPKVEDVCFSTGLCSQLGKGGECTAIASSSPAAITKKHPSEVEEINNLSGYSKVGLDWGYHCRRSGRDCGPCSNNASQCADNANCGSDMCIREKIDGYYPYSVMAEIGALVGIPNSNFEDGTLRPWKSQANAILDLEEVSGGNKVLRVKPMANMSGVRADKLADRIDTKATYVISFRARTDEANEQEIVVAMETADGSGKKQYNRFEYYEPLSGAVGDSLFINNQWKQYVMSISGNEFPDIFKEKPLNLTIVAVGSGPTSRHFYLDDIQMKTVLKIGDPRLMVARSCRMYPTQNAPACDYYDEDKGKDYRGWKGYCVESDPSYPGGNICLQWWPVDVISGETNIFSDDAPAGYLGRKPLYYCLESKGDYPYYEKTVCNYKSFNIDLKDWFGQATWDVGLQAVTAFAYPAAQVIALRDLNYNGSGGDNDGGAPTETGGFRLDMGSYDIYRDEIVEIKVKGVEIDKDDNDYDDCNVIAIADDTQSEPQVNSTKKGTLIFNSKNKDNWGRFFIDAFKSGGKTSTINKYIALRCSGQGKENDANVMTGRLVFNEQNKLIEIVIRYDEATGGGAGKFASVNITYLGERCNVIAQVVTADGENKAWTKRALKGGWTAVDANKLGYSYETDYAPYGSAVAPMPDNDPSEWEKPLYVMPANKGGAMQAPYQSRAGVPYGVYAESSEKKCLGGPRNNLSCATDNDCSRMGECAKTIYNSYLCTIVENTDLLSSTCKTWCGNTYGIFGCVEVYDNDGNTVHRCGTTSCGLNKLGNSCEAVHYNCVVADPSYKGKFENAQCITGGSDSLGKKCDSAADCGYATGGGDSLCWGTNLSEQAKKEMGATWQGGITNLNRLFAKSYGIWQWAWDNEAKKMRYVKVKDAATGKDANWDISYFGNAPQIKNILVNDTDNDTDIDDFIIVKQGAAIMNFTSHIDANQLPLVRYTVDWGDGTVVGEAGLRIDGKSSLNNAHIVVHYYNSKAEGCFGNGVLMSDSTGAYCAYTPRVQIEDNWGRCNGTGSCSQDNNQNWTEFKKKIFVYKDNPSPGSPVLRVTPDVMTYYSQEPYHLPYTQSFKIINDGLLNENLVWTITGVERFLATQMPVIYQLTPAVGATGTLGGNESQSVSLTITGTGDLAIGGVYEGYVVVSGRDINNGNNQIKRVKIILDRTNKLEE